MRSSHFERQSFAQPEADVLNEDAQVHKCWEDSLEGRAVMALPAESLRQLVYSGIPMKYRFGLWTRWIGTDAALTGDIENLKELASEDASACVSKDLPRTRPAWFDDAQLKSLELVLLAYAGWDPGVGYCQGMNFIAAVFISLGFCEVDALNGLKYVLGEICTGYHGTALLGFHRDAEVLDILVQQFLPSVHVELSACGATVKLLALDHFISLAARDWPLESVVRLWDIVLMEGTSVVFASFLALLEICLPSTAADGNLSAADGNLSAADLMHFFKRESQRQAENKIDLVIHCTRKYMQLISVSLIKDLRSAVMDNAS
jgi:hypothetical protein